MTNKIKNINDLGCLSKQFTINKLNELVKIINEHTNKINKIINIINSKKYKK